MVETIVIQNVRTEEVLEMDKFNTPDYILDYVDWGQASVDQYTSKYINQIGVSIVRVSFKSREIEISGFIVADTEQEMSGRKMFLNGFINPQEEYNAIYKDYKIMFQPTVSVRYTNTEETSNNEVVCRFKISGVCPYSLFSLVAGKALEIGTYVKFFHFPFSIDEEVPVKFAVRTIGDYRKRIIKNNGHISASVKLRIKATGNVTNPTIHNFSNNQFFKIVKQLQKDEVVEIDTTIGSKKIIGGIGDDKQNYYKYMSRDSSWLSLDVGDNLIGYSAELGQDNLLIEMDIMENYLEVQECY